MAICGSGGDDQVKIQILSRYDWKGREPARVLELGWVFSVRSFMGHADEEFLLHAFYRIVPAHIGPYLEGGAGGGLLDHTAFLLLTDLQLSPSEYALPRYRSRFCCSKSNSSQRQIACGSNQLGSGHPVKLSSRASSSTGEGLALSNNLLGRPFPGDFIDYLCLCMGEGMTVAVSK